MRKTIIIMCICAGFLGQGIEAVTTTKRTTTAKKMTTHMLRRTTSMKWMTTTTQAPTTTTTTTTSTSAALIQFQGVVSVTGPGLTQSQVVEGVTRSILYHYNVPLSAVSNVVATESRRLVGAPLRKLAGSWSVSFTLVVSQSQVAAINSISAASDSTAFTATMQDALLTSGVPANVVSAMTVQSLSTVQLGSGGTGGAGAGSAGAGAGSSGASGAVGAGAGAGSTTTTTNTLTFYEDVTGGSSLPETAFLSIILMSTIVMTFMM